MCKEKGEHKMNKSRTKLITSAFVGTALIISMVGGLIYLEKAKEQRDSLTPRLQNAIHVNLTEGQVVSVRPNNGFYDEIHGYIYDDIIWHNVNYVEYNDVTLMLKVESVDIGYVFYSLDNILAWSIE